MNIIFDDLKDIFFILVFYFKCDIKILGLFFGKWLCCLGLRIYGEISCLKFLNFFLFIILDVWDEFILFFC